MVRFRVVSFNVRSLRDDTSAVAQVLRDADADVVCLQESPKYVRWRGKVAALARRADLLYVAGGRTTGGVAMLTAIRVGVRSVTEHRLPATPGLTRRGLLLATLTKGGATIRVGSMHLGLDAAERARHLTEITGLVDGSPVVTVLAGDVNESPSGPTWTRLAGEFTDLGAHDPTPTFSTANPRRRIDGIFVRGPARAEGYQVLDSAMVRAASDHRPVVADVVVDG